VWNTPSNMGAVEVHRSDGSTWGLEDGRCGRVRTTMRGGWWPVVTRLGSGSTIKEVGCKRQLYPKENRVKAVLIADGEESAAAVMCLAPVSS
jgi:hypothetical protein